jgi:hypothetical protein
MLCINICRAAKVWIFLDYAFAFSSAFASEVNPPLGIFVAFETALAKTNLAK